LCPENNTYGFSTITKLRDLAYPNLFLNDGRYRYAIEIPVSKFGFTTSGPSRAAMLTKLEEYLRTGMIKVYSSRLLDELRTFIWYGDSPRAQKGYNDDLVMALGIGASLYDPAEAAGEKKTTSTAYLAMLAGFGVNRTEIAKKATPYTDLVNQMIATTPKEKEIDLKNPTPESISWLYR
jgi:hypothetical protein